MSYLSQPPSDLSTLPTRACSSCRQRKRKCDKQVPVCTNCKWYMADCKYDSPSSRPQLPSSRKSGLEATSPQTLPWMRSLPNWVSSSIRDFANVLFTGQQHLDECVRDYFLQIHPWFPFLCRGRFERRLHDLSDTSSHNFILLACAMNLILYTPPHAETGPQRSSHYMDYKRLLMASDAESLPTLDLIQCHLLLTFYEINQGATDAAYISLGMCSRAGIVIGLNHLQQAGHDSRSYSWHELEEGRRTWWAIMILDRLLRLQRPTWPAAVADPRPLDILPIHDEKWARSLEESAVRFAPCASQHESSEATEPDPLFGPVPLSTCCRVRVGYFARLAQVMHLLGLVLNNRYHPTSDEAFNAQEMQRLRETMAVFVELLPKEASVEECGYYCGPIAICFVAQLILEHRSHHHATEFDTLCNVHDNVDKIVSAMVDVIEDMNAEAPSTPYRLLRAFAIYPIFHAAQVTSQRNQRYPNPEYKRRMRVLLQALDAFGQRWQIAGVYKATINSTIGALPA